MYVNKSEFHDDFNVNAVLVMSDFDLWIKDFIEQIGTHKEDTQMLKEFQDTLELMIQAYYCSLMSKEEHDDIIEFMNKPSATRA